MEVQYRSYSSAIFRPRPVVRQSEERNLLTIVTPWGSQESAESTTAEIFRFVEAAVADVEVTSPFEKLSCLTQNANYLRTALSIANESLFRGVNKNLYNEGVEVLMLMATQQEVSWASVGFPQIVLKKSHFPLQILVGGTDFNFELAKPELAPLPSQLLGLHSVCNINAGSVTINKDEDKLILFSGSYFNAEAYTHFAKNGDLDTLTRVLSSSYSEMPFWLAQVHF